MVTPGVKRPAPRRLRWVAVGQVLLWAASALGAFLLLAKSVQNSAEFGRLQPWILLLDVSGVIALTVLLARKLWRLVRDYRAHVPGSRLTARTVAIFGALVIAPLLIVYLSSLEFINRGIDSWFKVEVKQGLNDALGSRARRSICACASTPRAPRRSPRHSLRAAPAGSAGAARCRAARQPGARGGAVRRARAHPRGEPRESAREPAVAAAAGPGAPGGAAPCLRQPRATGRWRYLIRTAAALGEAPGSRDDALRGRDLCGAGAARGAVGGRAELVFAVRRPRGAARAAQVQLPPDADAGAAARDARRDLWRDILRAAPGAPGAGSDRGHARRRQGRFRHAPAAALAR